MLVVVLAVGLLLVGALGFRARSKFLLQNREAALKSSSPVLPDLNLKQKIDALDDVRVNWPTVKKRSNGDVFFTASVLTQKGRINVSTVCGMPKGIESFVNRRSSKTLEQLLKEGRDEIKKEPGERKEPEKAPVVEFVTPDVSAAFALESKALENVGITG